MYILVGTDRVMYMVLSKKVIEQMYGQSRCGYMYISGQRN